MKRKNKNPSVFLLAAIVLLLAAGIFAAVYTLRGDPVGEALSGDRVLNVLFVIEQNQKPLGAYVLMYYPATGRAAIFDIPGELGLLITRINRVDRIDAVYSPGRISGFESEIEGLLGIDISFSIVLTMENLGKVVDLLEGVELFIPSPVDIRGDETVLFPSGVTRLDGDKAAMYVRYEVPEEGRDSAVFRRQRFFLGLLKRQGEMNEVLKNPAAAKLYQSFLNTGMSRRERIRLFDEFARIDTDRTNIQSVGGNPRELSGQTLLIPFYDGSLVKEIVRQTLGALTRQTSGSSGERVFTVEVLNGTAVNGLAGRTAELLRGFGYDVISIGNADHADYEKTEIIDRSGQEDIAETFAEIIRCENIHVESIVEEIPQGDITIQDFEYRSDFTLIIGRDFDGRYVRRN
ncbi:MAG: LCP family protein [Treponema sp.]|nr:LCP family protein [Treponema sp.]